MEMTIEMLESHYEEMSDDELVELETRGTLTAIATQLVAKEINRRSINRRSLTTETVSPTKPLSKIEPWCAEHPQEPYWETLLFGRVPLAVTFWGFWLLGKLAIVGVTSVTIAITGLAPLFIVPLLYEVFVFISTFNSARAYTKSSEKPWGALVLVLLCIQIVGPLVLIMLASGGYAVFG